MSPGGWRVLAAICAIVLLFGALTILLQSRSGAFHADYAGYQDEPSHYLNGLLIRDYISAHRPQRPVAYAVDYYAHYPKVTIGHWPPLFHCLEGAWMLAFSASRSSVMIMMAVQMALLGLAIAWMARWETDWAVGLATGTALLLLPISSEQSTMVMTEILLSLLCSWAVLAWARYLLAPSLWRNVSFGWIASAAILVKGDAVALAFVPLMTLALTRGWRLLARRDFWAAPVIVVLLCAPFYVWTKPIASLGWAGGSKPSVAYVVETVPEMGAALARELGVPLLVLSVIGLAVLLAGHRTAKSPLLSSVISFLAGGLLFQAIVPAGMEDRKLYYLLPACLTLAAAGVYRLVAGWRPSQAWIAAMVVLACALAHFQIFARYDRGFRDVARLMNGELQGRPGVILVSSNYLGEGLLVASVAEVHPTPAPYVIRANQLLADTGWAQPNYHLNAETTGQVAQQLATIRPNFVVLDQVRNRLPIPHDQLLRALIQQSPEFYQRVFARTTNTNYGIEDVEVYRAFPISGANPSLDRVYTHLQKTLSTFLDLSK